MGKSRYHSPEPDHHWRRFVHSSHDAAFSRHVRRRERVLGRPLHPVERFYMAHAYAARADKAHAARMGGKLAKSRTVRGNTHIDPRSGKAVVVPTHSDKRPAKRPKPVAPVRAKRPTTDTRRGIPAKWDGQGPRIGPTAEQLSWAREKHGERLPPGRNDGEGHTIHHMVTFDPPLNGNVIAQWYDGNGKRQAAYTAAHREQAAEKKWASLFAFERTLPKVRKAVKEALKEPAVTRTRVIGAIVAIIDQTAMRIGSAEYAEREDSPTFGASTLLKEHVEIRGESVIFTFVGKHGVKQERRAKGKDLVATVRALMKQDGPRLFTYPDANGDQQAVKETAVGGWLDGFGVNPKTWRTYHGCKLFLRYLAELPEATTEAQRKKNVTKALDGVCAFLGNTRAVAKKDYVNPALIERYMDDGTIL